MDEQPTYTITRERVMWSRWDADALRMRISHPIVYMVAGDGQDIRAFDTKREAQEWIKAQS